MVVKNSCELQFSLQYGMAFLPLSRSANDHDAPRCASRGISEVAVRSTWRKRGLALALLHQSFGEFYTRGICTCALSVDTANPTGATRLYEHAGMHPNNRTLIRYRKKL